MREADEEHRHTALQVDALPPFTAMALPALAALLGKGNTFISQNLQSATLFGDYRVDGAVMNVAGYNDYAPAPRRAAACDQEKPNRDRLTSAACRARTD